MKKRILPIMLVLWALVIYMPVSTSANENSTIQLGEHLPVTVQPGETLSISVDLRNNENYTGKDCVIILEDYYGLEIGGCEGGTTFGNTGSECYVQFKGLPMGTIYIHNRSNTEARNGTVWFSEVVPVESFSIGDSDNSRTGTWGELNRVVGGDAYIGSFAWDDKY